MKHLLNKLKGAIKYMSRTIQNEMIEYLGTIIEEEITEMIEYLGTIIEEEITEMIEYLGTIIEEEIAEKIKSTPFFSIMADTTINSTKMMLSELYRYVDIEYDDNGVPSKVNVVIFRISRSKLLRCCRY